MSVPKRYTITSALPYANGPLHIGHLAGAYLTADIYARYLRLRGRDVVYICGSDEHGAAITLRAKKEGVNPQDIVDRYHASIKDTFERFGISFDIFYRTSAPTNHQTSQEIFTVLNDKGEFVKHTSKQYYDEGHAQFLADRYITGECPKCHNPSAYGDQCEKCGTTLSPLELVNPVSALSGDVPVLKETTHWYLPLDRYQPWLEEWLIRGKAGQWKKNVYGQCSSWLKAGLRPRSMTRDLDWGIDVPLEEAKGKKLYVWLDAPIGYISATKEWARRNGRDWELYWKEQKNPEDNSRLIHFIGKDNIVFHCIIFPSILHAHGGYLLPDNVPANEFLNLEGDKISTSRNWAVWVHEYLDEFPGKEDVLRYVLLSIAPETRDSEFTWKDFQERNNSELANVLGNLVNRLKLIHKYCGGLVPAPLGIERDESAQAVLKQIGVSVARIEGNIEGFRFRDALQEFMSLARLGNKYLTDEEPWRTWKTDAGRASIVLYTTIQLVAAIAILAKIFLPKTADKIFVILNIDGSQFGWDSLSRDEIVGGGHLTNEPVAIFPYIKDAQIEAQIAKLEAASRGRREAAVLPVPPVAS
jgi:methionyl-tRNA synthetase